MGAAPSPNMTGVTTLEGNLSAPKPIAGTSWRNSAPVDDTVQPDRLDRTGNTNPLSTWLEETFGVRVPQISPLIVTSNASAPNLANQIQPAAPAGEWQGSDLGMPAIPGTWTPSTSQEVPPGFVDLSDPNLAMIVMPWGDDVIYVPDPVLGM
jgi:hypothetical protein